MSTSTISLRSMELLLTYSRNPSLKLRNQLVHLNAGLVRKVAHQVSKTCNEPFEDLEQIGYLALIRAVERFNPNQGTAFSSFAIPYIRGEMLHYLRDRSSMMRIPRRWQDLYSKGKKLRKELTENLGRSPISKPRSSSSISTRRPRAALSANQAMVLKIRVNAPTLKIPTT
jgi:RNA polymerase sigma-B factor